MSRGAAVTTLRACLCVALVGGCGQPEPDSSDVARLQGAPQHVVLLTVDTLRADHTSLYGYARPTTPFLERLSEQSTVFERAVVQWPKTGTSFASMFTGRYPQSSGLTHKAALRIPAELPILPEVMRAAGFRTVAVVSNAVLSKELGWDRGFDEYVQTWEGSDTEDPVAYRALLHATRVNEIALDLLDRHRDAERLFLWVHYSDPHAPYILPPERVNPFLGDSVFQDAERRDVELVGTVGKKIGEETDLRFYRAQYDANVLEVDRALEEMVAALEVRDLWDDALTLVTADHGESLGEHELFFEHGPLPYNPSLRVPLLVRGKGLPAGLRVEEPVELLGLVPTLAELVAQLSPPEEMLVEGHAWPLQGRGARRAVGGEAPETRDVAFSEAGRGGRRHYRAVQDSQWKLVFKPPREAQRSQPQDYELYDLVADPLEENNVLSTHPGEVRRLRARLLDWMQRTALAPAGAGEDGDESSDPEALRALRAMGYIQ